MMMEEWENLPDKMKNESVRKYYELLNKKRFSLLAKRVFDFFVAIIVLIILSPVFCCFKCNN